MPGPFTDSDLIRPLEDLLNDVVAAVNARVQSGYDTIATVDGTTVAKTITFPVAFSSAPQVTLTPFTAIPDNIRMSKLSVSTTQVVVEMFRKAGSGSGDVNFDWIAVV